MGEDGRGWVRGGDVDMPLGDLRSAFCYLLQLRLCSCIQVVLQIKSVTERAQCCLEKHQHF